MSDLAATEGRAAPGTGRRRLAVGLAAALVLVGIALAAGQPRPGEPYDPRGVGPLGLAGLLDLLDEQGVRVEVSRELPSDMSTSLFIATDRLGDEQRDEVRDWVGDGGTLVVAGESPLHGLVWQPGPMADLLGATPREPRCDVRALDRIDRIEHSSWEGFHLADEDAAVACFAVAEEQAWLVLQPEGEGAVVALGSAAPFVNANLARADNAALAAALFAPAPGDALVVLEPGGVGEGDAAVLDLVPEGFWRLTILLGVAVVLAIVWTARRLGRPVEERLPPVLPSAELARSVAGLLQRSGDRGTAASRLRADARREVERAWGLPSGTARHELIELVVGRLGVARDEAEAALGDSAVGDDAALVDVATACVQVRQLLLGTALDGPARRDGPHDREM